MNCPKCNSPAKRFGKDRYGEQRYRCLNEKCTKTFFEPHNDPLEGMYLPMDRALLILQCLVEGNSVNSTSRITNIDKRTVLRLLRVVGDKCRKLMKEKIKNVPVEHIQADEIWCYVAKKEGHKTEEEKDDPFIGDAWIFMAMEATTKLTACFVLGRRDTQTAIEFMENLLEATGGRFQLSTDGFKPYIQAVKKVFGDDIDYGQLIKSFASTAETENGNGNGDTNGNGSQNMSAEHRYSPGKFIGAKRTVITGKPKKKISTSYVERQNLTMRMNMRRFTRLTNGFSKKWENLYWSLWLHFAYVNFCRIHESIRVTPAMEARITDHVWSLQELLAS